MWGSTASFSVQSSPSSHTGATPLPQPGGSSGSSCSSQAHSARINNQNWLVRRSGAESEPDYLASLPILGAQEEITIGASGEALWIIDYGAGKEPKSADRTVITYVGNCKAPRKTD